MALRGQIPEGQATWPDPLLGINLRESEENLKDYESRLMQNCEYYGATRIRRGSQRINGTALSASHRIRGGQMYYYGGAAQQKKNLVAYSNRISALSGSGTESILTSSMTADQDMYISTWPITDKAYFANKVDVLSSYDGTTWATVGGTNIPTPRSYVIPILDRLMCVTVNGIERTNPRVDSVWSHNSSWATLRPSQPGLFTALAPASIKSTDSIYDGALAFQERAYYIITGTDFGNDVTSASASTGEDAAIRLLDPTVGTNSPYSICTVPGIGIFWFTSDCNIFWIPEGQLKGRFVGDKIQSTVATQGIESCNLAALSQVWITYFDRMLMVSIPLGSNTYPTVQFWMDMRSMMEYPDRGPVWYGPMTGQSLSRCWVGNQQGDNLVFGGEGNPSTGAFVYQLRVPGRFTDAQGLADIPIQMSYQTPFKSFGTPSREKYIQAIHLDMNSYSGQATLDLLDLDGTLATDVPIVAVGN